MKWCAVLVVLCAMSIEPSWVEAQDIRRVSTLFEAYKQSVVKIVVTGSWPDGSTRNERGTGFVIANSRPFLFVVTAGHVVGDSSTTQDRNKDWYVEGGRLDREIVVNGFDSRGFWVRVGFGEHLVPNQPLDADIAILVITNGPEIPAIPLMTSTQRAGEDRAVMLMGFRGPKEELSRPIPTGKGARTNHRTYATDRASRKGESGGPWIDIREGGVIAVASRLHTSPDAPSTIAVPVDVLLSVVRVVIPEVIAGLQFIDIDPGGEDVSPFAITEVSGGAVAQVSGTMIGDARHVAEQVGEPINVAVTGNERSDCNPTSGLTRSSAELRAQVSETANQGLQFDYQILAQGGHFRTAVAGCLGRTLLGLSGNDTETKAELELQGAIAFEARRDQPLTFTWRDMPAVGAEYRLVSGSGQLIQRGAMAGTNSEEFDIRESGDYRLETKITRRLAHRGHSGAPSESASPQIMLSPPS